MLMEVRVQRLGQSLPTPVQLLLWRFDLRLPWRPLPPPSSHHRGRPSASEEPSSPLAVPILLAAGGLSLRVVEWLRRNEVA